MYDKEALEVKKKVDKLLAHKTPQYKQGYNKAIDDMLRQCVDICDIQHDRCDDFSNCKHCFISGVTEIAERLKS